MRAIDGPNRPFLVVHSCVVVSAERDGVIHVGQPAQFPGSQMVDLAPGGDDGAAGGLTSTVPGQDGPTLGGCEGPVGSALVEYAVVLVPDLAHQLTVTS